MKSRFAGELMLVIYDITDDSLRLRVSNFLKSKGLIRVQKSAFLGRATKSLRTEVEAGLRRLLKNASNFNIQIYPIPPSSFHRRVVIGSNFEEEESGVLVF